MIEGQIKEPKKQSNLKNTADPPAWFVYVFLPIAFIVVVILSYVGATMGTRVEP